MMGCVMLILASKSPRRAQMLSEAGFRFLQVQSPFVDPADPAGVVGEVEPGRNVADSLTGLERAHKLAGRLAEKKALALIESDLLDGIDDPLVIGADTICVDQTGKLIGTPEDEAQARAMITAFEGHAHWVVSACCLVKPGIKTGIQTRTEVTTIVDHAQVTVGQIGPDKIAAYLSTGKWQGKAGGYNLSERVMAGWPISVEGDPDTVTGLPVKKLAQALSHHFGIQPDTSAAKQAANH
jgi:septum formation protein